MKKYLLDRFLPMWAKETVLSDNRQLRARLRKLEQENKELKVYIQGLHTGMRGIRKITVHNGGAA